MRLGVVVWFYLRLEYETVQEMKATKILKKKDAGYASRWKQKRGGKGEQRQLLLPVLLRMCVCVSVCLCALHSRVCIVWANTRVDDEFVALLR